MILEILERIKHLFYLDLEFCSFVKNYNFHFLMTISSSFICNPHLRSEIVNCIRSRRKRGQIEETAISWCSLPNWVPALSEVTQPYLVCGSDELQHWIFSHCQNRNMTTLPLTYGSALYIFHLWYFLRENKRFATIVWLEEIL